MMHFRAFFQRFLEYESTIREIAFVSWRLNLKLI